MLCTVLSMLYTHTKNKKLWVAVYLLHTASGELEELLQGLPVLMEGKMQQIFVAEGQ